MKIDGTINTESENLDLHGEFSVTNGRGIAESSFSQEQINPFIHSGVALIE